MKKTVTYICMAGLLAVAPAGALTRTWQSAAGGSWTNTANWSGGTLPVASDIADLTAATGTIDLAANVTVGEILYNPAFSGTTNTLTILSDTAAPSSRTITLTTTLTNHVQVGEGAELLMDADLKPTGNVRKDGQGTLVIKRRVPPTVRTDFYVEQGRLVNEGTIALFASRMHLGTVAPDAGPAPVFVMRAGSSFYSTTNNQASDLLWGCNRLLAAGTGARAVVIHEGGILDLTTNSTGGVFLNGYAAGGNSEYTLSGGEVNLSSKTAYVGFYGTGTVNQAGGKFKVGSLTFSYNSAAGRGVYNLTGGELWLGGGVNKGSGTAAFNLFGGGRLYPFNTGFTVASDTNPRLTNGLTRFCSTGSGFTNTVAGLTGTGGFVKEGPDTLNLAGTAHSFTGPVIVSNGTVNVFVALTCGNVLVADGSLNIGTNANLSVKLNSLMVTGGVCQVASNSVIISGTSASIAHDPWVRVAGTGTLRLLGGSQLLCLNVSESGVIDLSAGGTATVYRFATNGVELAPGLYTSANCEAITGPGTLAVILQKSGAALSDTFSRADVLPATDSLGKTEVGGADWAEFSVGDAVYNAASITNGELRLGVGNSDPMIALTAASRWNGMASTRMRFNNTAGSGATVKNGSGLLLRRNISRRINATTDYAGAVQVVVTPAGGLFTRENYQDNKYLKNPFTGDNYYTYGAAGTLPTSINGLPFDANGDGRLGNDEPFGLKAILSGKRLQVLINDEPVGANNGYASTNSSGFAENCAGLMINRLSSGYAETHDSYHDDFAVTNLPFLIRHINNFDPSVTVALPRENWDVNGDTNLVQVGAVTETVGSETVKAWKIDDASAAVGGLVFYSTALSAPECDDVNTNWWRYTMRLRVVNTSDAVDWGVAGEVASDTNKFTLNFGSDASGNALVTVNNGATNVVSGGSVYHTYTLDYNPRKGTASLFSDGALLQAGVTGVSGSLKRLVFGAGSSAAMGCAHYQQVQFELLAPPLPPPPGTMIRIK